MRILIVGYDTPGALERYCAAALRSLGHEVFYHDLHHELIRHCRFRQTPVLSDLEQAALRGRFNRRLVQVVESRRPDMVLVFKGVELAAATLERLRALPDRPLQLPQRRIFCSLIFRPRTPARCGKWYRCTRAIPRRRLSRGSNGFHR